MKIFGYFDDVISWQLGLEWYWSWAFMFGMLGVFYIIFRFSIMLFHRRIWD